MKILLIILTFFMSFNIWALCLETEHLENDACVSNEKVVDCDINNNNPVNSEDIIADVTVIWDGSQYSNPELCLWQCSTGYHDDGGACVADDPCLGISCGDNEICDTGVCICDAGYHDEAGICVVDDACLGITCENNEICDAGICICAENFHLENSICETDTKNIDCDIDNNNPLNSSDTVISVEVIWDGTDYSNAELCEWNCDTDYVLSPDGTTCEEIVVDLCDGVQCQSNSTCNAQNGNCDCDTGYVLSGSNCIEDVPESEYDKLIKTIVFTGDYSAKPIMLNTFLIGIEIENISTTDVVTELLWDASNDETKEKLSLMKGAKVILKVETKIIDDIEIFYLAEKFEIFGAFLLDEDGENYEITLEPFDIQLVGTIAGVKENGNPYLLRDERNLNSYVRIDLDKDGIYDVKLKIPFGDNDINEVLYDMINGVVLYDGEVREFDDEGGVIEEGEATPSPYGCDYGDRGINMGFIFFFFFSLIIIFFRKKSICRKV